MNTQAIALNRTQPDLPDRLAFSPDGATDRLDRTEGVGASLARVGRPGGKPAFSQEIGVRQNQAPGDGIQSCDTGIELSGGFEVEHDALSGADLAKRRRRSSSGRKDLARLRMKTKPSWLDSKAVELLNSSDGYIPLVRFGISEHERVTLNCVTDRLNAFTPIVSAGQTVPIRMLLNRPPAGE
jgi:hypothetical protein